MLRKIPVRSILFLSLIQIGLLLLLLAWWGGFYQFLLPAAVLGQADWGTGAWLAAELLLILFVMNRFFEGRSAGSRAVPRRSSNGPKSGCMRRFCVPSVPWVRSSAHSESWGWSTSRQRCGRGLSWRLVCRWCCSGPG